MVSLQGDTRAACEIRTGAKQYHAYCSFFQTKAQYRHIKSSSWPFWNWLCNISGYGAPQVPAGYIWLSFYVHVMDADTLILLLIDEMGRFGIYLNNVEDVLFRPVSVTKAPVIRACSHPFMQWDPHISCQWTSLKLIDFIAVLYIPPLIS